MRMRFCIAAGALFAGGCASIAPLNDAERAELAAPPAQVATRVAQLVSAAVDFVSSSEQQVQARGRPLNADEQQLARAVGVAQPENVRVLVADQFIAPLDPAFAIEARKLGLGDPVEGGRTLGHAIQIKPQYANAHWLLAHELTHVGQFERLGANEFVREYLTELLMFGYARAPLERAAASNEHLGS
jgi:hypothetical protein